MEKKISELITNYASSENAKFKKDQLKKLYDKWFEEKREVIKGLQDIEIDKRKFTRCYLLTCFDSYLKSNNRIMIFGKESNEKTELSCSCDNDYFENKYYAWEEEIINGGNNSNYSKVRRIGFNLKNNLDKYSPSRENAEKVLSVINNNLNKTSLGGMNTKCSCDVKQGKFQDLREKELDGLYGNFKFEGFEANIFIHEINILRPNYILLLCGKDYYSHIKRAFGNCFYEKFNKCSGELNIKEKNKQVSNAFTITQKEIDDCWSIKDYGSDITFVHAYHPSSRINIDNYISNILNRINK